MPRACLATRTVYRCLLRAVQRSSCPNHRHRLQQIVRLEFRDIQMAREASLDDALSILRDLNAPTEHALREVAVSRGMNEPQHTEAPGPMGRRLLGDVQNSDAAALLARRDQLVAAQEELLAQGLAAQWLEHWRALEHAVERFGGWSALLEHRQQHDLQQEIQQHEEQEATCERLPKPTSRWFER